MKEHSTPHDTITLQPAGAASVETLAAILTSSFLDAYRDEHSLENMKAYCSKHYTIDALDKVIKDPSYGVYLASRNHQDVGALVLHHHPCPLKPDLKASELKQLYVLSSEYGTGLGKRLMEIAFEVSQSLNNEWLWLCVSDRNHRAQRFYQKMNFKKIGTGPVLEVGTERLNSSIMMRSLA